MAHIILHWIDLTQSELVLHGPIADLVQFYAKVRIVDSYIINSELEAGLIYALFPAAV